MERSLELLGGVWRSWEEVGVVGRGLEESGGVERIGEELGDIGRN